MDLLRPGNRGMQVSVSIEEGMVVRPLHKQPVSDELELRRLLVDACENRACHTLPVGATIDTSSAVFELAVLQTEMDSSGVYSVCNSRFIVVDTPTVDPLCISSGSSSSGEWIILFHTHIINRLACIPINALILLNNAN